MWPVALHQIVEMEHNLLLNFFCSGVEFGSAGRLVTRVLPHPRLLVLSAQRLPSPFNRQLLSR